MLQNVSYPEEGGSPEAEVNALMKRNRIHYYLIYDVKLLGIMPRNLACEALVHVWYCTNLKDSSPHSGKFQLPLALVCRVLL